jgi:hypothetical protein
VVVDGDMEVVVADPAAAVAFPVGVVGTPVQPPPAAGGDPAQLLDINVEQLTGRARS